MTEHKDTIVKYTRTKNGRRLVAGTNYDALAQDGKASLDPEVREIQDAWEAVDLYFQKNPSPAPQTPSIMKFSKTNNGKPLVGG